MSIELMLTLDHNKLSDLLGLRLVGNEKIKIAYNSSNLEEIRKKLVELLQMADFELDYDEKNKKWLLRSNSYSILEKIRKKLIDHIEVRLVIKLDIKERQKLSEILNKDYRIIMLDYTSQNKVGFMISKFSSPRYINALVALSDVPLVSIVRFSSSSLNKIRYNEECNFHVDKLSLSKNNADSFWLNNYLKSKRSKKQIKCSENMLTDLNNISLTLISSLRGVITGTGILLPWPFSSFELATSSHKLYTLFLADIKIVDEPKQCQNINILGNIFDREINGINYINYQQLNQNRSLVKLVKFEGEVYLNEHDNVNGGKITPLKITLITLSNVVSWANIKGKIILGVVLGQAFESLSEKPLFLLHVYNNENNENSQMIKRINEMNFELRKIIKNPLSFDAITKVSQLIYNVSYKNGKPLGQLSGNLELLSFISQMLNEYRTAYKKILNDGLVGKRMITVGQKLT